MKKTKAAVGKKARKIKAPTAAEKVAAKAAALRKEKASAPETGKATWPSLTEQLTLSFDDVPVAISATPQTLQVDAGIFRIDPATLGSQIVEPAVASLPALDEAELIELFPHGITIDSPISRPVLILKDKSGLDVLPVWMNNIDAGIAIADLSQVTAASSVHQLTRKILLNFGYTLESCIFEELQGHHQFVSLNLIGEKPDENAEFERRSIRVRADEAMSFALQMRSRFFARRGFMAKCRDVDANMNQLEQGIAHGMIPDLRNDGENGSKKHPYVM